MEIEPPVYSPGSHLVGGCRAVDCSRVIQQVDYPASSQYRGGAE